MLVCDHASNRVPSRLANPGLDDQHLASHIGWDSGAAGLARQLSARLDAPLVMSRYSRLVIDCNRPPGDSESIPASVAGITVPGIETAHCFNLEHRSVKIPAPLKYDRI